MGSYSGSSSESCRGERWGRVGTAVAAICARHHQNTFHWPSSCSLTSMFKSLSPAGSAHISFLSLSLPPSLTHIDTPIQPSQDTSSFFFPHLHFATVLSAAPLCCLSHLVLTVSVRLSWFLMVLTVARAHAANSLQLDITPLTATVFPPFDSISPQMNIKQMCCLTESSSFSSPPSSSCLFLFMLFYASIQIFLTSYLSYSVFESWCSSKQLSYIQQWKHSHVLFG